MSAEELQIITKALYDFHGAMKNLETHLELNRRDKDRIKSLQHLKPIVARSYESLQVIEDYMAGSRSRKVFGGVRFDKKLKLSLKYLDDAGKIFNVAILINTENIQLEVDAHLRTIGDDVKEVQQAQSSSSQNDAYLSVRAWLGAKAASDRNRQIHDNNLSLRYNCSGEWLFSHAAFQHWLTTKDHRTKPKFWLRGSPGAGKSLLCSTAIEHVRQKQDGICLYYFYSFDDNSEVGDGSQTDPDSNVKVVKMKAVALLVDQLFRHICRQDQGVTNYVYDYIKTEEMTIKTLEEVVRLILRDGYRYAQGTGNPLNTEPIILYVFIDGLDGEKHSRTAADILKLFDSAGQSHVAVQKYWVSSRDTTMLDQHLETCPAIVIDKHAETDIQDFLTRSVRKFDKNADRGQEVVGEPLDDWVLRQLKRNSQGNFLYAKLMVEGLKKMFNIDDVVTFIKSGVPNDFENIYRRIFGQYQEHEHKYISLLFSFIGFARRPLHLHELEEAMTLALSDPGKGLDPRKAPFSLQQWFGPLIQIQHDPNGMSNPLCRLCHSTVLDFLLENPEVLRAGTSSQTSFDYGISASRVGDICLRYLSLERYSTPLELPVEECHASLSVLFDDVKKHAFLTYSAKYWDRHMEDLEPTQQRRKELHDFLRSSNFQTLLQVQSLSVSAHFTQFRVFGGRSPSRPMHRRVFPSWFGWGLKDEDLAYIEEAIIVRLDYRHFVNEWGYLLDRGICENANSGECRFEHFFGEVHRCLTGLLGPTHFMTGMKERYASFMLTTEPFKYHMSEQLVIADALSATASQFMILSSPSEGSDQVSLDMWDLKQQGAPRPVSTSIVSPAGIDLKSDATRSVAFSHAFTQFLFGNRDRSARLISEQQAANPSYEPLSTDIDSRDGIVVVATRSVHKHTRKQAATNKSIPESTKSSGDSESDSSENESDDDSDDEYLSSSTDDNSADETCSEGSTDIDSDQSESEKSESDSEADDQYSESSEEDDEASDIESETEDDTAQPDESKRTRIVLNYEQPEDNQLKLDEGLLKKKDEIRPTYPGMPGHFRDSKDRITAGVVVYNVSSGQAVRMFRYEHDAPAMLYHSPPALHPTKSLLVWPLGGGEVLFADYEEKTYFTRAAVPTTNDTRHICMKVRFSSCGGLLHIASVEGRVPRTRAVTTTSGNKKSEIVLSLFLTTHRLSLRKTTRSPPKLVHKVKLTLGHFTGLSLAKLPFTFTWTPEHLHFTVSGTQLNVFRINLLRPAAPSIPVVTVPRLPIMLPISASARQVYYIPPDAGEAGEGSEGRAIILMGSYGARKEPVQLRHRSVWATLRGIGHVPHKELPDYPCPAVGIFVKEQSDLGGWVALDTSAYKDDDLGIAATAGGGQRLGDGKLTRKIEL
ncbi:Vegetative incompatibility protein HET-E-1 [Colletotrichum siamense]|nr:Vegetative incompatibility protein HET-E-1 [Colletotrichum siamense]